MVVKKRNYVLWDDPKYFSNGTICPVYTASVNKGETCSFCALIAYNCFTSKASFSTEIHCFAAMFYVLASAVFQSGLLSVVTNEVQAVLAEVFCFFMQHIKTAKLVAMAFTIALQQGRMNVLLYYKAFLFTQQTILLGGDDVQSCMYVLYKKDDYAPAN